MHYNVRDVFLILLIAPSKLPRVFGTRHATLPSSSNSYRSIINQVIALIILFQGKRIHRGVSVASVCAHK